MLVRITLLCTFLTLATAAVGQQTTTGERRDVTPPKTPEQSIPHEFELNFFGGGSYFRGMDDSRRTKLVKGGVLGSQFTVNPWNYVGIETGFNIYGVNNVRFLTPSGGEKSFGSRVFSMYVNPVFHFTNRLARVRPYVSAGFGANVFYPTREAKREINSLPAADVPTFAGLDTSTKGALNAALGVKWRMNDSGSIGMRFDLRGIMSDNPQFHVATGDKTLWGVQPTVGINFWMGKKHQDREFERTVTVTTAAPPPVVRNNIAATNIQGVGEVCGGTPVNLSVAATSTPATAAIRYQWALNGTNSGTNQNTFTFTAPEAGGNQTVTLTMTDTTTGALAAAPVTVTQTIAVRPYVRPTIRVTAGAAEVDSRGTVPVTAVVAGDCGGALTTTWTASEGRITGTGTTATFDASTVTFPATGAGDQVKQVTVTANVRDTRNGAATATAPISVRKRAEATQLFDILFTAGSAVVNNCGQRILTDDVYPQFRNGYTVVLVGHTDASDRNAANLDRNRAYNVGRLLATGGRSPNNKIDPNNIRVEWVATDQTAPKRSRQCEASVREAAGRTVAANDAAAQNRRVEVWLIPPGAPIPASARSPKELPAQFRR
jgi:outer membrane protein OmpA-like peptidoglycan-associated protein